MSVQWDEQRLAALTIPQLQNLRKNAMRTGAIEVAALCDAELAKKRPGRAAARQRVAASGESYVIGFHLVARADKGVTINPDGTFWSGVWVIARIHAERAPRVNAYLALHETKAEGSYRQGVIRDWRVTARAGCKIEDGVEFLVEPTDRPYDWHGTGTGEKGYKWFPEH